MLVASSDLGHRWDGGQFLFRGLDLQVQQGDLTALIGPSGLGKSTLLGIVAGLITPTEGDVSVHGIDSTFWVMQQAVGVARRTAVDHVALVHLARGAPRTDAEQQARATLERFRLGHRADALFGDLSGGEATRLMFARAVALAPDMLLVDEPTAQLDSRTALEVASVIQEVAGPRIVLVATHDPAVVAACNTVVDLGRRGVPHAP